MFSVLPQTVREADVSATEKYGVPALGLMKAAAKESLEYIYPHINRTSRVTILCGKGNNAGDGYGVAYELVKQWYDVCVVNVFDTVPSSDQARTCYNDYIFSGGTVLNTQRAFSRIAASDVIIDAVFGIGFDGVINPDSECGRMIECANSSHAYRIAIDVPSGINSADGTVKGSAFMANTTITVSFIKTGTISYPALEYCGEIVVADINYPEKLAENLKADALIPDDDYIRKTVPVRPRNSHKGTFGKLAMLCGSKYMTGAAYFAALSAVRTGAGLVTLAADEATLNILQTRMAEPVFFNTRGLCDEKSISEITGLFDGSDCALVGCGLGSGENIEKAVQYVVKNTKTKLVIDADGINALSGNINVLREAANTPVITPHPAEFARITGKTVAEVQSNRLNLARQFAKDFSCITVLKGASTVITSPDGRTAINRSGNSGLAKGGSGDVLAGAVASFVCQGLDPFDAAVCAVYLHGKASDVLKHQISEYGMLPSDLPLAIAKLLP